MNTSTTNRRVPLLALLLVTGIAAALPTGCERKADDKPAAADTPPAPTNRVDINASVRQNLGMTFAKVESRAVNRTLRVPGRFELLPTAAREYRAVAPGTVELLVTQYQTVEPGTPLYRVNSPRWREVQRELADAEAALAVAEATAASIEPMAAAHENHHTELQKAVDLWAARVVTMEKLQAAGGARGDEVAQARASLATARSNLAETFEKEAQLAAQRAQAAAALNAARSHVVFLFETAGTLTGMTVDELRKPSSRESKTPRWQSLREIEVRAVTSGVIDAVHAVSGGIVDEHAPVLSAVQPGQVRFRAVGLQSDLGRLADGQRASVVSMQAKGGSPGDGALTGALTISPVADAERRTVELVLIPESKTASPAWARAGVTAFLEVITSGSGESDLAIPLRCVARDGTQAIIFRRDPANPDKAIRMEAELGIDDGRWVVIKSGVAEGNEVVLDGVYQLMVATSGSITKGGHFHPDGSFHEGSH